MSDKIGSNVQFKLPKRGAFILRYWQTCDGSPYRFMLKSVKTSEHQLFQDMPSLMAHLQQLLEQE